MLDLKQRLESFLDKSAECWVFIGALNSSGYGSIRIADKVVSSHRLAYTVFKGEIADDLCVLHSCNNRACCNPDHLRLGTHAENMHDKKIAGSGNFSGSFNSNAKLTEGKVRLIRQLSSTTSDRVLAKQFNVHSKTIGKIRRRVLWPHI